MNEAQARTTIDLLKDVINPESTIGVVAPYAAQGALIDHLARQKIDEDLLAETRFVCGTAHRLQGSERDTIIFSSTLTPNMPANAANWIEQERKSHQRRGEPCEKAACGSWAPGPGPATQPDACVAASAHPRCRERGGCRRTAGCAGTYTQRRGTQAGRGHASTGHGASRQAGRRRLRA